MSRFERLGPQRLQVGESPVWSAREACWYWVDITAKQIWRCDAQGALRSWQTAEMPACLTPCADGGLLVGMETGLFHVVLGEDGGVGAGLLAAPPELGEGMRFNDGATDRQGRYWAGTMFMDMAAARDVGCLYRFARETLSAPVVRGLLTQNGTAFSPDGRTMYLSDSHPKRQLIWAFDYDTDSGTPHNQRLFVDMNAHPGRPDGAAVDADGCYWTCANDAGLLLRFSPRGELVGQLALPMAKPSMCAFGGPRMDQLLVTSISAGQPADDPWAGAVLLLEPGVQGLAATAFGA